MSWHDIEKKHKWNLTIASLGLVAVIIIYSYSSIKYWFVGIGLLIFVGYLYNKLFEANEHDKKLVDKVEKELILFRKRYPEQEKKYEIKEENFDDLIKEGNNEKI